MYISATIGSRMVVFIALIIIRAKANAAHLKDLSHFKAFRLGQQVMK